MKLTEKQMRQLRKAPNAAYAAIKTAFLYYSNKLGGSSFTEEELAKLVEGGIIEGSHTTRDVLETLNSLDCFDYVIDTLGDPITDEMFCELNRIQFRLTPEEKAGYAGHFKTIPNRLSNARVQLTSPEEVPAALADLIAEWNACPKTFEDIVRFHVRFEQIHPFQNGNGRIGRYIMLKQCIECGIDVIAIDEEYGDAYMTWMGIAQQDGDFRYFIETMQTCQDNFSKEMVDAKIEELLPTE